MQSSQNLPPHTLTLKQLIKRPNLLIISEEGQRFRTELRDETIGTPPKMKSSEKTLRSDVGKYFRVGNSSFYQVRSKEKIVQSMEKSIKIKRPYEHKVLERMTTRVLREETPITNISNRLVELYTRDGRRPNKLEESLDAKDPTYTIIQSKVGRLQDSYQLQLIKRETTKQHIQRVLEEQKQKKELQVEHYDFNFERPRNMEVHQSFYQDPTYLLRKQVRLREYQKSKYEVKYYNILINKTENLEVAAPLKQDLKPNPLYYIYQQKINLTYMSQIEPFEHHYNNQYLDVFGCSHQNRHLYCDKMICVECGIFLNNPNTRVYKTLKMKYNAFFDSTKILQGILNEGTPKGPAKQRQLVIEFIIQASERLNLSANTTFLAIEYMDECSNKINDNQIYLYAATSLMLAAKAQELDERVPFISKLKRYASMTSHPEINNYSTHEFKTAERILIQTLEWKLQRVTILDRIEALLSFGVIDDDDSLGQQQKENKEITHQQHTKLRDLQEQQILNYVKEVETKYIEIAMQIIRDDQLYFSTDQSILALSSIAYLRKKAGLLNIWSQQLQALTGVSAQKISSTVSQIMTLIAKSKSFKTLTKLQLNTQTPPEVCYQLNTPSNTLTAVNTNHLTNRQFYFETKRPSIGEVINNKSQIKIFQSQSTVQFNDMKPQPSYKNINFTTSTNYSYLNDNGLYLHAYQIPNQELDKKYEQVHKVSGNMFRPV